MLHPHVASLAKADEVGLVVSLLAGLKISKGFDVVNRQSFPFEDAAMCTEAALRDDDARSSFRPVGAAICRLAALPIGGVWAGQKDGSVTGTTLDGAKAVRSPWLTGNPRGDLKLAAAKLANEIKPASPSNIVLATHGFASKGVCRPFPAAVPISDHVRLRPRVQADAGVPRAAAPERAKAGRFHPVWLDLKRRCADFAEAANHTCVIASCGQESTFMGSGTTGVACQHLGRNFIGVEKEEAYFKIAEKRIKGACAHTEALAA